MLSLSEENYLKAICKLQSHPDQLGAAVRSVSTNEIADQLNTKAGSVTEMLKKLSEKDLVVYTPYQGAQLTDHGHSKAMMVIRRHRLWETFLVNTLGFEWHKVHALAEELEHIRSEELIERLDTFLQRPGFDPHGDPIPNADGTVKPLAQVALDTLPVGTTCTLTGVKDHDPDFLRYLHELKLYIGSTLLIQQKLVYDGSNQVSVDGGAPIFISQKVAANLHVVF